MVIAVFSFSQLKKELKEFRQRGYTTYCGEWIKEVASVGAPVIDINGNAIAALVVSLPENRITIQKQNELGMQVRTSALHLSRQIGGLTDPILVEAI